MRWLLLGLLTVVQACPPVCRCTGTTVDCSNRDLLSFPRDLPFDTITLNLRGNKIGKLSIDDVKDIPHLETLLLSENRIRVIDENVLDAIPLLRRLTLTRNRLTSLPSLAGLHSLIISLDLRHNKIAKIAPEAFSSLSELVQLDLSHNHLQSLHSNTLQETKKLSTLHLHRNPWLCDCRIGQVATALSGKNQSAEDAKCFNPRKLRGTPLVKVTAPACSQPTATKSELHTELHCTSTGTPVVWLYRNVELDHSSASTYELTPNDTLLIPLEDDHVNYTCTSDARVVPHRTLRQIGSPPQFTLKPKDSSYREGTAVKLHCEVIGSPKPAITWYHKEQALTPTRKYEFTYAGSVLKIYPFLEEDAGSYTCAASNIHGRIEHTASILLVASIPPNIIDGPASQSVEVGQQVTFRCRARGVPKPDISWFFDGSVIPHIRGRVMVSEDGQELTIGSVTRPDAGSYSCMAGNSVGAMMADARLTVKGDYANQVDALIDDSTLQNIAVRAKANVDRALTSTRVQLNQERVTNPGDLKRLFRFSIPAQAVALSKAREIYEESIRLVHEHVQRGLKLPVDQLAPNVSYEAVLAVSHVQTLMELSGCQSGQVLKDSCSDTCFHAKYRSYDGQCNNRDHPMWGVASMPLLRLLPPIYENGFNTPVGWERGRLYRGYPKPNPREVSRQLVATDHVTPHSSLSAMVMQWGQFVDHDLTHTATALSRHSYASGAICNRTCENLDPCFNIPLTATDIRQRGPSAVKYPCMEFERSGAVCGSGETSLIFQRVTYRDQMNVITSFLDGSVVYGSSEIQALELRDLFNDHGLMRFDRMSSTHKPYLPFEKDSEMDCRRNFSQENPIRCFLAGDLRANEQLALSSMHTVFLREHNRVAANLLKLNPSLDGETIYQETRKIVSAMIQHITYTEWLPTVLGKTYFRQLIGEYGGYNPKVHPSISNAFATAAFRFGHTLINPTLFRLNKNFTVVREGHLPLHKAFFAPERLLSEGGVDPLLRGLFASPLKQPKSSQLLNTELTEKLFNRYHEVALDLAVMNIQRGRDHGLPGYTEYRRFCNLSVPENWHDMKHIVPDKHVRHKLKGLYGHPANIDLWVGGIVEQTLPDALMGPTFACIIADQFKRVRDADRFWYENEGVFSKHQLAEIKKSSLSRLFCDNGDDIDRVQRNVFLYPGESANFYDKCDTIPSLNLRVWRNCCDNRCSVNNSNTYRPIRPDRVRECHVDGEWKRSGEVWNDKRDTCTECKCEDSKVWCSVKRGCQSPRRDL